ncbi:MAG: aldehyde dehydrogenase family protein [Desulforegulaceae bacterium]|nr:aldehyde dehydrogenase family protein [Desulforegulaceae bacterium]
MLQENESSNEVTISFNKATGEKTGSTKIDSVDSLKTIIENSRKAQKEWKELPIKKRTFYIKKLSSIVCEKSDEIAKTIVEDNGKTKIDAMLSEILPAAMATAFYTKKAKKYLKTRYIMPGNFLLSNKISRIKKVPFGVIGIISPWNYPFAIPFSEIVMGLLAGNTVVLKVASETQMVGKILKEVFEEAGLPENVFNYVNIPGRIAGDAFLENGIDKLFFTGSVPVGKYLMGKASETLTPVSLELGGNDAALVCKDADIGRTVDGIIWAGFQNAGQSCGGVERVYVHEDIYDPFMKELKIRVENLRIGYDEDFNVDIGLMTTKKQVETVKSHLKDALEKGAEIYAKSITTDENKWNNLVCPCVLSNVNHEMIVMKEETFGPLIGVMKIKNMDEGIDLANDSNLGLTASVWSSNRRNAIKIASKIKAGAVTINDHLMSHGLAETPWGGFKESGIGRAHGELGFAEMTEPQVIVNDILPFVKRNMWWHPHSKNVYFGLKGIVDFLYGKGIKKRFSGLYRMLKLFPRTFIR